MKIDLKKCIAFFLGLVFFTSFIFAEGVEKSKKTFPQKVAGVTAYTKLNIANFTTYVYNNGNSDIKPNGDAGWEYPKGSARTVFFESGPMWGAYMGTYWTVGGSAYRQGLTSGYIQSDGTASAQLRVYRVRPDYKNFTDAESMANLFATEMADEGITAQQAYDAYNTDWQQWPANLGAPFIDKNGNGVYDPAVDIAGMSENSSQTIWFVGNDLDASVTVYMYGGLPLKVECQGTFFAFNTTGVLGNTEFRKYKIINKNTVRFDSMYVCMWSDPDLGDGFNDFVGCDTTLNLVYVYNGESHDNEYGNNPPACGFVFFQGPMIPGNAGDRAIFNGGYRYGYKNMGMTSIFMFSQGADVNWSDPTQGSYLYGAMYWKNLFQGKLARDGTPYTNPRTGLPTKFPLSGDPLTRKGWIDGLLLPKNDRRMGEVSGPFTMNPGDTQEVVVGQVAAGGFAPVSYLSAVSMLKFYVNTVQAAYNNFFKIATPPPAPQAKATEMPNSIILSWSDSTQFKADETYHQLDYTFEGYNVYQYPSITADVNSRTRIATFDVIDGILLVERPAVDLSSGAIITEVASYGTDSGIQRFLTVNSDAIKGIGVLYTGSRYYFGVTAFAYSPTNTNDPVLESTCTILTTTPQPYLPGQRTTFKVADSIAVVHSAGVSSASVIPVIVDPKRGNGKSYEVSFTTNSAGRFQWNIKTDTGFVFKNQYVNPLDTTLGSLADPIVAGAQVHVAGPQTSSLYYAVTAGVNPYNPSSSVAFNYGGEMWNGGLGTGRAWLNGTTLSADLTDYHPILIKFANTDATGAMSATDPNASSGYRFMRAAQNAAASTSFAPFIINHINYGFQEFGLGSHTTPNMPLAVYDLTNQHRLAVGFLENNVAGSTVNGIYYPPLNVVNSTCREYLFIFSEDYSTTTLDPARSAATYNIYTGASTNLMYFSSTPRAINTWSSANQISILKYNALTTTDKFTFTVPAPTVTTDVIKADVNAVNVFPNPYYGVNPQEINKYERFVTFTHLPQRATIKIFNISGQLVATLHKDDSGQLFRWNIATDSGLPVPSGIYVAYIDMYDIGVVKKLKVAIIQEQQFMDRF